MREFTIPDYLKDRTSVDQVHNYMLGYLESVLPSMDFSEGSFLWDLSRSAALEFSRVAAYHLVEAQKNCLPQFSYAPMLDEHAYDRFMYRKEAGRAEGDITITGTPGAVIEAGTVFQTLADKKADVVQFENIYRVVIPESGKVEKVLIKAVEPGAKGNVAPNTIISLAEQIDTIFTVTNPSYTSGGSDVETDAELRERIRKFDQRINTSWVGTEWDYKLWAEEVEGVGKVKVEGCQDETGFGGDGIVHITVLDASGHPANEYLLQRVRDHILSPDDPSMKRAAVNSRLDVKAPEPLFISITAEVVLDHNPEFTQTAETLAVEFAEKLDSYFIEIAEEPKVNRRRVGAELLKCYGVVDYEHLRLNGQKANLKVDFGQVPMVGEITFTEVRG